MSADISDLKDTWARIRELIEAKDGQKMIEWIDSLPTGEVGRLFSRLNDDETAQILELIGAEESADLMVLISEAQAADIIEELPIKSAAAIVDELDSDEQADILGELDEEDAEAILSEMDPEEASDARRLIGYEWNTAGGVMITEYLNFNEQTTTQEVLENLRAHRDEYADYDVQYIYIIDNESRLKGILKLRDLLLSKDTVQVGSLMLTDAIKVRTHAELLELREIFESHDIIGIPVVDRNEKFVGVVRRAAVEEAFSQEATEDFLMMSGLSGEEELRDMPFFERAWRRLWWLSIGLFLSLAAATVIEAFGHVVKEVVILAALLPVVANLSGASGNQAVAVSIRELTLGIIKPWEVMRVLFQELGVGAFNGLCLGTMLGVIVGIWQNNVILGLVVGTAMCLNCMISVTLGGCIPLLLKWAKHDPALASGPLVMTLADACGFFITLILASMAIVHLVPVVG